MDVVIQEAVFECNSKIMSDDLRVRLVGGVEKWKDKKDLVFPYVYLVGGMEKWKGGKPFCLIEKKSGRIKHVVYIN